MKKFICLLFSIVLAFSLSIPAFAATTGTFTVSNDVTTFSYTDYSTDENLGIFYAFYDVLLNDKNSQNVFGGFKLNGYSYMVVEVESAGNLGSRVKVLYSDYPCTISGSNIVKNENGLAYQAVFDYSVTDSTVSIDLVGTYSFSSLGFYKIFGSNYDLYDENSQIYTPATSGETPWLSGSGDTTTGDDSFSFANFFANIGDFIVSLFVPEDGYIDNWLNGVVDDFEGRSGLLTYPLSLLVQFVDSVTNLSGHEPILTTTDIVWQGVTIIPAMTYNFNDLLKNSAFNTIYQIYLIIVKAGLAFALVKLAKRKFDELIGGESNAS